MTDERREGAYVVPAGWKLVPINPTREMIEHGRRARYHFTLAYRAEEYWRTMIATSPNPPEVVQDAG